RYTSTILVATVGNPKHTPLPSLFDGVAREHSRKPDEFYWIALGCTPLAARRADLFSPETPPGFGGWGKELGKFDQQTAGTGAPVIPLSTEGASAWAGNKRSLDNGGSS